MKAVRVVALSCLALMHMDSLAAPPDCPAGTRARPVERLENTLHWETKSETLSAGFDVFRSTTEEGRFEKVNDKPLPSKGISTKVIKYEYVDGAIEPCLPYFYYVEAIGRDGHRTKVTSVLKASPKNVDAR